MKVEILNYRAADAVVVHIGLVIDFRFIYIFVLFKHTFV
jgi:hypothetical protein